MALFLLSLLWTGGNLFWEGVFSEKKAGSTRLEMAPDSRKKNRDLLPPRFSSLVYEDRNK